MGWCVRTCRELSRGKGAVMGREGRRERREERREENWEREHYEQMERESGLRLVPESEETFGGMQWGDGDELEPKPDSGGPDPWRSARLGTVRDVAQFFQVHWKTVAVWRRKGGLPCVRQGGVIRYVLSDVLRWASARKVA